MVDINNAVLHMAPICHAGNKLHHFHTGTCLSAISPPVSSAQR